ncbi:MAG: hypothetical protein ACE5E4_03995 [Candidatus Binatia bacterium]
MNTAGALRYPVVLVLAAGVLACGLKTPPRPPEDTAPVFPTLPQARRDADGSVSLSWKRPTRSADGRTLHDLAGFVIEKRQADGSYREIAVVETGDAELVRPRRSFVYVDVQPSATDQRYRLRAFLADGQQGRAVEMTAR